ncbi:MAG: hypothetical protein II723_02360 [Oscillospiraceae bacterium]|nr:hypothetical protein [Oscillospiraceae bacterium]
MQPAAAMIPAQAVDLRWLLTGLALALLLGVVCRAAGRLLSLIGERLVFSAECTAAEPAEGGIVLSVRFSDRAGLSHRAALLTDTPAAPGDRVKIAVDCRAFRMGSYPQTPPEAAGSRDVLLLSAYRAERRKRALLLLMKELLLCGAAFALFLLAKHRFFS